MIRFTEDFIQFYIDLASNNSKEWFDVNRSRYEQHVKIPFKLFVSAILDDFAAIDPSFEDVEPSKCIFRINRDIRFSRDKTPYKLMSSAVISSMGKTAGFSDGVYIELSPEHVRLYGGIYQLETAGVNLIRAGIVSRMSEFKEIISEPRFVERFGFIHGDQNKIIPKEFREVANHFPLLFNKQWYFYTTYSADFILEPNFREQVVEDYKVIRPIQQFFKSILYENK